MKDLRRVRLEVLRTIHARGYLPVGMELFGAHDEKSWPIISEFIDQSACFVLLLGSTYGTRQVDGVSFTEAEYNKAYEKKLPIIVVDCRDLAKFAPQDAPSARDVSDLQHFREKIIARHSIAFARSTSLARDQVAVGLDQARLDARHENKGWVYEETYFAKTLRGEGDYYSRVAQCLINARERVVFCHPPQRHETWVFRLLPGLVHCLRRGVRVDVVAEESRAFELLRRLGCNVHVESRDAVINRHLFSGIVVDPGDGAGAQLFCETPGPKAEADPFGTWLSGIVTSGLTKLAARAAIGRLQEAQAPSFKIRQLPLEVLATRLRRVGMYKSSSVRFELAPLDLERARPMQRQVEVAKKIQSDILIELYKEANVPLFAPAVIEFADGESTWLVPPIVEESPSGQWHVAEGHTRLYHQWEKGSCPDQVLGVIVKGCTPPAGVTPYEWKDVLVALEPDRTTKPIHSRSIEKLVHSRSDPSDPTRRVLDFVTPAEIEAVIGLQHGNPS